MDNPLVFFHASGASARIWRLQIEGLVRIVPLLTIMRFESSQRQVNSVIKEWLS